MRPEEKISRYYIEEGYGDIKAIVQSRFSLIFEKFSSE